ncbi:MAG: HAMP domain-containing sensor histidine kinase [Rikenellaceae bacterium]
MHNKAEIDEYIKGLLSKANILEATSSSFIVVNKNLDVIFSNTDFRDDNIHGAPAKNIRPGDIFLCINAVNAKNGCGSSPNCPNCKFRRSITDVFEQQKIITQEVILTLSNNVMLALNETAFPVKFGEENYVAVFVVNISDAKRRELMDRVFYHDLINLSGAMDGYVKLLLESTDRNNIDDSLKDLKNISGQLFDEIMSQRDLMHAEKGDLKVRISALDIDTFLKNINARTQSLCFLSECSLEIGYIGKQTVIQTDCNILDRVIFNIIKNAFEASEPQEHIKLDVEVDRQYIVFKIHNKSSIPEELQSTIFQFGTSTKGSGHGIGTYSIKLLGENYLKGKVWFESTPNTGTDFMLRIPKSII